jgi:ABC-type multidrug transport system fused ATPase/permease subunit
MDSRILRLIKINEKDLQLIRRAFIYIKPDKGKFILTLLLMIFGTGIGLVYPLIWAKIVSSIFGKNFDMLMTCLMILSGFMIFQAIYGIIQNYISSSLSQNIILNIKKDMYKKILDLPVKAFDEIKVGEFISRLQGDSGIIANIITSQLFNIIVNMVQIVVLGITIFCISIPLSIVVLLSFPFSYLLFSKLGKIMRDKNNELLKLNDRYFSDIQQSITGIREIKGLGLKKSNYESYISLLETFRKKSIFFSVFGGLSSVITQAVGYVSQIGVIGIGAYEIFKGLMTAEMFIAFSGYSTQFSGSLMSVTGFKASLTSAMGSLERIFAIMDNFNYPHDEFGNEYPEKTDGTIRFENVVFGYEKGKNVLNGLSFEIKNNRKTAIVGRSGSGKTTIFNLLQKFYVPDSGRIVIDGMNMDRFSEEFLRNTISTVHQDPFLFNASIRDNLLLACPGAGDEEIINACKDAYIHDFITGLPGSYDFVIGENGVNLSVGQKQRIAIARVLLKKSKIVLFDEATSSLDNESQHFIKKAIDNLSADSTVVIIAHRLATIIESEEIIVIDGGKVAGSGAHRTLIRNNGIYRTLYNAELDLINRNCDEGVGEYAAR